jgi:hypothetical protein
MEEECSWICRCPVDFRRIWELNIGELRVGWSHVFELFVCGVGLDTFVDAM